MFIDRDGTLNEEREYISTPGDLHMIPGAAAAVRKLNVHGVATCVFSNQSGIGRGFFTEDDLVHIHDALVGKLRHEGAALDRIYYCPHHPTEGIGKYRIDCDCRKPKPGMLLRGAMELNLDLTRSFVIGDSVVDIQAGNSVGAKTILVLTGYGTTSLDTCTKENIAINHVAPTIMEAVNFIIQETDGEGQGNKGT